MNWPFIIRQLCEHFQGTTPRDYEHLTRDQLYIMMLDESTLKGLCGVQTMSVSSAVAKGIIKDDKEYLGGYRSLAEKLNAEARLAKMKSKRQLRSERRALQEKEKQRRDG